MTLGGVCCRGISIFFFLTAGDLMRMNPADRPWFMFVPVVFFVAFAAFFWEAADFSCSDESEDHGCENRSRKL
jgi:hypothetical protein